MLSQASSSTTSQKPRGQLRCGKLTDYVPLEGFTVVNCCSTSKDQLYRQLSPMLLGPYTYETDTSTGDKDFHQPIHNLENFWQFSKVWDGEETFDKSTNQMIPSKVFFDRRAEGWADKKAHRWVKKGEKPLYAWWKGQKLDYMQARRTIYCPLYAEKVVQTEGYHKLEKMLECGYNLQIVGYDGYDYHAESMSLSDAFNDVSRPFGHELVLCGLLTNDFVWQ